MREKFGRRVANIKVVIMQDNQYLMEPISPYFSARCFVFLLSLALILMNLMMLLSRVYEVAGGEFWNFFYFAMRASENFSGF